MFLGKYKPRLKPCHLLKPLTVNHFLDSSSMKVPRRERHRIFQCLLLFLLFYIAREIYRFSGMSSLKTIQTTSSADSRTHNFFKSQKPKIHLLDPETVKDANISKPRTHECLLLDADTYNMSRAIISPLTLKEQ